MSAMSLSVSIEMLAGDITAPGILLILSYFACERPEIFGFYDGVFVESFEHFQNHLTVL